MEIVRNRTEIFAPPMKEEIAEVAQARVEEPSVKIHARSIKEELASDCSGVNRGKFSAFPHGSISQRVEHQTAEFPVFRDWKFVKISSFENARCVFMLTGVGTCSCMRKPQTHTHKHAHMNVSNTYMLTYAHATHTCSEVRELH